MRWRMLMATVRVALRNWEQGVRNPEGAARILLQVVDREPDAVMRALRG